MFGVFRGAPPAVLGRFGVPTVPPQRPIVEFALEDRRKLRLREQRIQRGLVRGNPLSPP